MRTEFLHETMIVELHEHNSVPRILTDSVGSLSYTHSVKGSVSASLTLYLPLAEWGGEIPVKPGAWLVIRDLLTMSAHWWGYVTGVSTGRSVARGATPHGVDTIPVQVSAASFVDLLAQAQIILAPAIATRIPGAVYQFTSWEPVMKKWMESMKLATPGLLLAQVFLAMAQQPLPLSLGGGTLGQGVPVAHTALLAPLALAGRFDAVPGQSIQAFKNVLPRGTIWSMIQGTFGADPALVELFHGTYPSGSSQHGGGVPLTPLEIALNCTTRLIYRMAPLHPTLGCTGAGALATGTFVLPPTDVPIPLAESDVLDWSVSWSDGARKNGYWTDVFQLGSQMGAYGILAQPLFEGQPFFDAGNHGLRMHEVSWPFWPTSPKDVPIQMNLQAIIDYAAHVLQQGHLMGRGSLTIRPNAKFRPGQWVVADVGARKAGIPVPVPWSCYVEEVTHSVQVDPNTGVRTDSTTLSYSYGFFGLTRPPTPLPPLALPPDTILGTA